MPSARAIHEAAYAVSAAYRGGGLDSVELLHDGCGVTRCLSRLASPDVEFKVTSLGVAAELLLSHRAYRHEVTPRSCRDAAESAALVGGIGRREHAEKTLRWAAKWVRVHRAEILTVARHLDHWKNVTGDEVRAILGLPVGTKRRVELARRSMIEPVPQIVSAPNVTPAKNLTPLLRIRVRKPSAPPSRFELEPLAQKRAAGVWRDRRGSR